MLTNLIVCNIFKTAKQQVITTNTDRRHDMAGFYDYSVKDSKGNEVPMSSYQGKVVLVVNTATGCGFTPHYAPMEEMYEKYHDQGLEILDIPCNQFAGQTPGSDEEIHEFCQLKYKTQFPQMHKTFVNNNEAAGEKEEPLYTFLKSQKGFEGFEKDAKGIKAKATCAAMNTLLKKIDPDFKNNSNIKWNFTKFVVDRQGNVVRRFEPTADMGEVEKFVAGLL